MVLYTMKYDVRPEKANDYRKWATESAIPKILDIPGLVEFCGYRPATGSHQMAVIYTFKDIAAAAAWLSSSESERMLSEFRSYATNVATELWGPSPVTPEPRRPKS